MMYCGAAGPPPVSGWFLSAITARQAEQDWRAFRARLVASEVSGAAERDTAPENTRLTQVCMWLRIAS